MAASTASRRVLLRRMLPVVVVLLLLLVWSAYAQQRPFLPAATKQVVCFHNLPRNPRAASLFERGTLNRYTSQFLYIMDNRATKLGIQCDFDVNLVNSNHNTEQLEQNTNKQMQSCSAHSPCIVIADEVCSYEAGSNPNVIGRFYYSSDYKNMPVFALGPIVAFHVNEAQWPPLDEPRKFLFNFIGSRGQNAQKRDRLTLIHLLCQQTVGNESLFPTNIYVNISEHFKVNIENTGNEQKLIDNYKHVLLNSDFTLSPVGDHDECFRFWEAIEAGSIPVFVRREWGMRKKASVAQTWAMLRRYHGGREGDPDHVVTRSNARPFLCPNAFENILSTNPPIVVLDSWSSLPKYMSQVTPATVMEMRAALKKWNKDWWDNQTKLADNMIRTAFNISQPQ